MKKLLVLCLFLCLVFSLSGCKSADYKKAKDLYDRGKYEKALAIFEDLGNYEDSVQKVIDSKYYLAYNDYYISATNGYSNLKNGDTENYNVETILADYEKALALFEELGDYSDSMEMAEKIKSEMLLLKTEKDVSEVVELYNKGDVHGATNSLNSYLEISELNGVQYPYASVFVKKAEELLDSNDSLAYFIVNVVVTWAEDNNNSKYSASELYYTFPKLHWRTHEVGDVVNLGRCMQKTSGNTQPIEWVVIAKEDNKLLLLSKKGLRRGTRTDTYKQSYLQTAFTYEELDLIGSLGNIIDLSLSDYEKYKSVIDANPCIATYWAFMEKQSGVFQVHSRHQWQIEKLDSTPVCWYISDDKIVDKDGSRFAISPSEVYCRPSVWITIK